MENPPANIADDPPNESRSTSRKKLLIIAVSIAVVGIVASAFVASALLSKPTAKEGLLFKGAYAKYEGSTTIMGFGFEFSMKLEVLDLNDTHAFMSTCFVMQSSLGETAEEKNTTWVPLSNTAFLEAFDENNVTNSYDAWLDFGTLGERSCTVYEVTTDGPMITAYVDKEIGWPLKMKLSMVGEDSLSLSIGIILVETNIPILMS